MSDASDEASGAGDGPDAVAAVTARVREFLDPFEDVESHADGTCSLAYGSARVVVSVQQFDQDQAVVKVRADCVTGAKPSAELFEYVATNELELGHFRVDEDGDGTATISISHGLLGEFLNPAELRMTVVAIAYSADRYDDELAARFGGRVHNADGNTEVDGNTDGM